MIEEVGVPVYHFERLRTCNNPVGTNVHNLPDLGPPGVAQSCGVQPPQHLCTDTPCSCKLNHLETDIITVVKTIGKYLATCVTAAGWRAGNTQFIFMLAGVRSDQCTHRVITATRSSVTVMNTIFTLMGGHTLASPKGGGPCSLGTFNYGVVSHLAFQLT